jgi:hypothetical protein
VKILKCAAVAAATLLTASTLAWAQPGRGQRGGRGQGGGRHYNTTTEVTLSGTVDEVRNIPGPAGGPGGLHLMLRTDAGVDEVHLGPATFVRSKGFEFAKGDAITVTGSKTKVGGQDVVIAREIKKGDKLLTLRDAKGVPLWAGRGRRQGRRR